MKEGAMRISDGRVIWAKDAANARGWMRLEAARSGNGPDISEEEYGGQCGQSRVRKGKCRRRGNQRGPGARVRRLCGLL